MICIPPMDNRRIEMLIREVGKLVDGQAGFWRLSYNERELLCMADESHNRMRVMAPVIELSELGEDELCTVLQANFDRALDARYALSSGILWAVFLHPLRELTDQQFIDAVSQVDRLVLNYGSSYTSSDIVFDGQAGNNSCD